MNYVRYEAAPFIILDEIDAALDKINIKNVVNFIQSNTDLMHFIIISLKKELFVNADGLIGVSSRVMIYQHYCTIYISYLIYFILYFPTNTNFR